MKLSYHVATFRAACTERRLATPEGHSFKLAVSKGAELRSESLKPEPQALSSEMANLPNLDKIENPT